MSENEATSTLSENTSSGGSGHCNTTVEKNDNKHEVSSEYTCVDGMTRKREEITDEFLALPPMCVKLQTDEKYLVDLSKEKGVYVFVAKTGTKFLITTSKIDLESTFETLERFNHPWTMAVVLEYDRDMDKESKTFILQQTKIKFNQLLTSQTKKGCVQMRDIAQTVARTISDNNNNIDYHSIKIKRKVREQKHIYIYIYI